MLELGTHVENQNHQILLKGAVKDFHKLCRFFSFKVL
uniref:Uncharacterized protein n=1 Tax=Rhizophora mucronata TaxID=61149 RepID=A0A2P2L4A2_RHIMU